MSTVGNLVAQAFLSGAIIGWSLASRDNPMACIGIVVLGAALIDYRRMAKPTPTNPNRSEG